MAVGWAKDLYGRPTTRFCRAWPPHGLPLSPGPVPEGWRKLPPLLEPGVQARRECQRREPLCHGAATQWDVCAEREGQTGHRGELWGPRSASVVFSPRAPRRGAAVPNAQCAGLQQDLGTAVLVWDRYAADNSRAKAPAEIVLADCWAPVRRDFLPAARSGPALAPWRGKWREALRPLYRLTTARLAVWDAPGPLTRQSPACVARHHDCPLHLQPRQVRCERYRRERSRRQAQRQSLERLHHHWGGRTVVVARPAGALDTTAAERALRNPGGGRKHYDGAGNIWRAHLAAMLASY
jgi:transposase